MFKKVGPAGPYARLKSLRGGVVRRTGRSSTGKSSEKEGRQKACNGQKKRVIGLNKTRGNHVGAFWAQNRVKRPEKEATTEGPQECDGALRERNVLILRWGSRMGTGPAPREEGSLRTVAWARRTASRCSLKGGKPSLRGDCEEDYSTRPEVSRR